MNSQDTDSTAILRTCLDYIQGYYSGDVSQLAKSIHPDFCRMTPRDLGATSRTFLYSLTSSALLENTRTGAGKLPDSARDISIKVLSIGSNTAAVKLLSASFTEYLLLIKEKDEWKILSMLYTSGLNGPSRLKGFNAEKEYAAAEGRARIYINGVTSADAGKFQQSAAPEYRRFSLALNTTSTIIREQYYNQMVEQLVAGIGKQDEIYRNNKVTILDIVDGIALVQCDMATQREYLQMFKCNSDWQVLQSLSAPVAISLMGALTVTAGDTMPDFILPDANGKPFKLSEQKGKNVLLVFPRGWLGNSWCPYCPYQYLELEDLIRKSDIERKYQLKIAFVLPYSIDRIHDWMVKFPEALQTIEVIKNPQPTPAPGSLQADYAEWARQNFPLRFEVGGNDSHSLIPVLADENQVLSRQLKIFTGFWDNISSEQNMASVFIIDKKGVLQFKYISQMTEDRPDVEFLLRYIESLN